MQRERSYSDIPILEIPTPSQGCENCLLVKQLSFVKCRVNRHDWPMHQVPSRAYLIAPLFAPTLHVFLTPFWQVLAGNADEAVLAMIWQAIAWLFLQAVCLASFCPVLWLFRNAPLFKLNGFVLWLMAFALAVVASYYLFQSTALSWVSSLASAVLLFHWFRLRAQEQALAPGQCAA